LGGLQSNNIHLILKPREVIHRNPRGRKESNLMMNLFPT